MPFLIPSRGRRLDEAEQTRRQQPLHLRLGLLLERGAVGVQRLAEVAAGRRHEELNAVVSRREVGPGDADPVVVPAVVFTPETDRPPAVGERGDFVIRDGGPVVNRQSPKSFRVLPCRVPDGLHPLAEGGLSGFQRTVDPYWLSCDHDR